MLFCVRLAAPLPSSSRSSPLLSTENCGLITAFRINTCGRTPRFTVFWPQLPPLTIFRMSTYRSVSKHATSSPLDSALTQTGEGVPPPTVPPQSHLTTIPAPGCLHPCTMEIVTMEWLGWNRREPHRKLLQLVCGGIQIKE